MLSVLKFGGTSVAGDVAIKQLETIVSSKEEKVVVVVSALSGVTNSLTELIALIETEKKIEIKKMLTTLETKHLSLANNLMLPGSLIKQIKDDFEKLKQLATALLVLGEISDRTRDKILAYGEILSSRIVYEHIKNRSRKVVEYLDSRKIIKTDMQYTEAMVLFDKSMKAISEFSTNIEKSDILICGGFIASDLKDHTTTLGRGGSDYTAAIIASLLKAEKIEIWTDVDGVLTCDPRLIKEAKRVKRLSFEEASELAYFGAKVLHPKTIQPAIKQGIPVWVLNSKRPNDSGTEIVRETIKKHALKAIAFRKNITIIRIHSNRMLGAYGFLSKVFSVFEEYQTSVDLVATSEVSVSLTVDENKSLNEIVEKLSNFAKIDLFKNQAIISVVGEGIRHTCGIASRFFKSIESVNIPMISMGASEVNLSILVSELDVEKAVKSIHKEFFSGELDSDIFVDK